MQIIAIGGKPGSGKTTLMTAFMESLEKDERKRFGKLLHFHLYPVSRIAILGKYDGSTFAGTDRLSMAVMPEAIAFLDYINRPVSELTFCDTVVFEGDRLFSLKMLQRATITPIMNVWMLTTSDVEIQLRYTRRKSNQNPTWLKGRETKLSNIANAFPVQLKQHETPADTTLLVQELRALAGLKNE